MTREVPLTRGQVALVDDADYDRVVAAGSWYTLSGNTGPLYACRSVRVDLTGHPVFPPGSCLSCGETLTQSPIGRSRLYCGPACRRKTRRILMMHNFITGYARTDHIDRDGLNNRRSNLRPATHAENSRNTGPRAHNTSGFKGVHAVGGGRWRAIVRVDGVSRHLGQYATAEEAARAYDTAARDAFGEYAWLNFPGFGTSWTATTGPGEVSP